VFLAYASGNGHALIDRELYLPKEWAKDPARGAAVFHRRWRLPPSPRWRAA
jgi:SRSO17 transposase